MLLCSLLLLLLYELAFDEDLEIIADDEFAVEHHIERQAKILAVDFGLGTIGNAVAHHIGVIEFTVLQHLQCNRMGIPLDGQVAGHVVGLRTGLFDLGAFEVHGWILVNLQEIRGAQVIVPLGVVGTNTRCLDRHVY